MNTNTFHESAKIYQFPTHMRAVSADHRDVNSISAERLPHCVSNAAFGDCSYHEAAVNELIAPR